MKQYERDLKAVENMTALFQSIEREVLQGLNLKQHLKDVNEAITEIQIKIDHLQGEGRSNEGYQIIRRDLYYLVEEIMKRL